MPNWVMNKLSIIGNVSAIAEIKRVMHSSKSCFDFNKIAHKPKEYERIAKAYETGEIDVDASFVAYCYKAKKALPICGFTSINRRTVMVIDILTRFFANSQSKKSLAVQMEELLENPNAPDYQKLDLSIGKDCAEMMDFFKTYNPIEWGYKFWGTKWEAQDAEVFLINEGIQYLFLTANSNCIPIIEAIASGFPDIRIIYEWADEDLGENVGTLTINDYKKEDYSLDVCKPNSYAAFEKAADIWRNPDILDCLVEYEDGTYAVDLKKLTS